MIFKDLPSSNISKLREDKSYCTRGILLNLIVNVSTCLGRRTSSPSSPCVQGPPYDNCLYSSLKGKPTLHYPSLHKLLEFHGVYRTQSQIRVELGKRFKTIPTSPDPLYLLFNQVGKSHSFRDGGPPIRPLTVVQKTNTFLTHPLTPSPHNGDNTSFHPRSVKSTGQYTPSRDLSFIYTTLDMLRVQSDLYLR